jgi:hypothetical protein
VAGAVAGFVATLLILELTNFGTPADRDHTQSRSYHGWWMLGLTRLPVFRSEAHIQNL